MIVVKSIAGIESLEMPLLIKEQLVEQLLLPWDGQRNEADKFWDEVSTCLILIEPDDTDVTLGDVDEDMETLLAYALDNPEFVIVLPHETDPHVVAVCIHADDGGGSYIVGSTSNKTGLIKALIEMAE
ncbi:hypothetical protein ACOMICROBIO_NCLOACGD_00154 [Vibrio sp. B1ASS3]|uniref:hypothetical protein n=1 Tax=Vibrio sp. B1ASS3 TaxID=2751176 RepID=UPI001ABB8EC4|nr:hypothetical protein [Vibrio sp. B1ASS3]CAD7797251.1 hypothetical protein ACOMICROBIO_NCLOACGD_00154 [Vibrio sp. B1ASS3]CAE6879408.1 hypothetical protein ACOMICROBIO_NCLOACGD_00154 [Vibrio sp. B1ASS3]